MFLKSDFEYCAPQTLAEALELVGDGREDTVLLAGGTDLLLSMKKEELKPVRVVDLKKIAELNYIKERQGHIRIGAATSFATLQKSGLLQRKARALAGACAEMGSPQIRNSSTIGGNLVTASPAADSVPPLMVLEAGVVLSSLHGERELPLEDFLLGINRTALRKDEILTALYFKSPGARDVTEFEKLGRRRALSIARLSVAVFLSSSQDSSSLQEARISLGAVGENPFRDREAEEYLKGKELSEVVIQNTLEILSNTVAGTLGDRKSAPFKRESIKGVARRALSRAMVYLNQ